MWWILCAFLVEWPSWKRKDGGALVIGFKQSIFAVLLLLLAGCAARPQQPVEETSCDAQCIVHELQHAGVQVIQIGENITIVLPSDQAFNPDSANLNPNYEPVLDNVANLLREYQKVNVKVSGYTDNVGSKERNIELSKQRAEMIARYLWPQGTDTRLLYATGYGAADPIISNATAQGRSLNRRVEISFRYIPPVYI